MKTEGQRKRFKFSLSTNILLGFVMGVACGIFFGEYCAFLKIIGDAFIKLLQITILPYITVSLILGIGSLTFKQAKLLGVKAGIWILLFWAISIAVVLLIPFSFPHWESAAFFSSALLDEPKPVDFLDLYIPSNPFKSLANNIVPAVVLFSILTGVALISIKEKEHLFKNFKAITDALVKVTNIIVQLTPIGVFAISAAAAGTMTVEEFGRLQVYLVSFNSAALLLTFGILPLLVMALTPFRYKDIIGVSRDALITAFTTANLFVVLSVLTYNCKTTFEKYKLERENTGYYIDVLIPVSFNFPNAGKLIMLLFLLFGTWFSGNALSLGQYVTFVVAGLLSFFGGIDVALPFMLDILQLPADLYQLYVVTGVINGRTATLLAAMNLLVFTMLATCTLTGILKINWRKVFVYTGIMLGLTIGVIALNRIYFHWAVKNEYTKDRVIANMESTVIPLDRRVYKEVPEPMAKDTLELPTLKRIKETGILRVGYHPANLPFTYFNDSGVLVGFDIDMAHLLAKELNCKLVFIPFRFDTLAEQLRQKQFDVAMSGLRVTTDLMFTMLYSEPYMDSTLALVVRDHRREEFATRENLEAIQNLKIGISRLKYFEPILQDYLPQAEVVTLESPRVFFEREHDLDAILMSAEQGAAWTLLHPRYQAVVPKPNVVKVPVAYPIADYDRDMANFMSQWINFKKKDGKLKKIYDYWILGQIETKKKPRWSIIRNVLRWVK